MNDTIVVFDRIRENLRLRRRQQSGAAIAGPNMPTAENNPIPMVRSRPMISPNPVG